MSKFTLKNSRFQKTIKEFLNANPSVLDVFLYGSAAKGKREPRDVDLVAVFCDKADDRAAHELEKNLKASGVKADVEARSWKELFETSFLPREAVLAEGVSLKNGRPLSEAFGFKSFTLFRYSLKGFTPTRRVQFHYALNGRKKAGGMLASVDGKKFTSSTCLAPTAKSEEFAEFLRDWKIEFKQSFVLIPAKTVNYLDLR
ncbi:MAG: nucleotidyltransferase domain-containing protein [Candidatus Micrarchaeota archaeon]